MAQQQGDRRKPSGNRNRSGRKRRGRGRRSGGQRRQGNARQQSYVNVPEGEATVEARGVLQIMQQGHGFLRSARFDYNPESTDVAVPRQLIEQAGPSATPEDLSRWRSNLARYQGGQPCCATNQ